MLSQSVTRDWYVTNQAVSTPAITYAQSPLVTTLLRGDNYIRAVRWRFPPGVAQALGVSFWHQHAQIYPWGPQETYIVGSDEIQDIPIGANVFGSFDVWTLNLGTFAHTVVITVTYQPISVREATTGLALLELPTFTPAVNPYQSEFAAAELPVLEGA